MKLIEKIFKKLDEKSILIDDRYFDLFLTERDAKDLVFDGNCHIVLYDPHSKKEMKLFLHKGEKMFFEPTDVSWGDGFEI